MSSTKSIASLSISGEITLNLHALNNEGGEGNQIITRQVTIIDKHGDQHTVNAISGDMFKHIHAGHLINTVLEKNLAICEGCKIGDPNRISLDSSFLAILKGIDPEEFEEEDKTAYLDAKKIVDEDEELKSKEGKDAKNKMKEIEKKYIILKITEEEDKKRYLEAQELASLKIDKKKMPNHEDLKKKQDEAKKSMKEIAKKYSLDFTGAEKIDKLIEICTIDDVHGNLITAEKNNLPRKSAIEFGWTVGLPNKNNTESYIHTKLVADAGTKGSGDGGNLGQNIFHRPANHGVYAFVCHIEVYRIGFNDISREYTIKAEEILNRYKAVIQSLLSSFLNPRGAMTSTQKPHITDFKGVVSISSKLTPAPMISALNESYKEEITTIAENLNTMDSGMIEVKSFAGMGELSGIMKDLMDYTPYSVPTKAK